MSDAPAAGPVPATPSPSASPSGGTGKAAPSLGRRSLFAASWSLGGSVVQRGLSLGSNLVMTRLLVPEAFGLMAVVLTVLTLAEMVSDMGVKQSVVRSPRGEEPLFLRIAWSVQVLRGAAIAALVLSVALGLWLLGPSLAPEGSVYAEPVLPALIVVSTLAVLARGFESTGMSRAARRMDMRAITTIELGTQVAALAVMLALAWASPTVWALLGGMVFAGILRTAWTHWAFRDLPMRPAWDRETTREMWVYGRWIIVSSMAGFVVNHSDRLIFAALLDPTTFGLYAVATLWIQAGMGVIATLSGQTVLAATSEALRTRAHAFPAIFAKLRLAFGAFLLAAFLAMLLGADLLVGLLYTEDYAGAAVFLALLSFRFLTQYFNPHTALLLAQGRSRTVAATVWTAAAVLVAAVPLAWHLAGPEAAVLAAALASIASAPIPVTAIARTMPGLAARRDLAVAAAVIAMAAGYLWWST